MTLSHRAQKRGFTTMEVIIAAFIFSLFALGVYQAYATIYSNLSSNRYKVLAADLANAQFEIIKNMPYSNVGTVGGDPSGVIQAVQVITQDNVSFTVTHTILNVDDPFDGVAGSGDLLPHDYKLVEIQIECPTCKNFIPVVFTGWVAPENLEVAYRQESNFTLA